MRQNSLNLIWIMKVLDRTNVIHANDMKKKLVWLMSENPIKFDLPARWIWSNHAIIILVYQHLVFYFCEKKNEIGKYIPFLFNSNTLKLIDISSVCTVTTSPHGKIHNSNGKRHAKKKYCAKKNEFRSYYIRFHIRILT